ncbi:MAG: ribonuclease HI [Deltaproteobacteria bacterium]|nr:ribonuclease HI [Deltaproteobacteria bacterium]
MSLASPDLIVYTDGACSGNPGPGGWAAVLVRGPERMEIGGREAATTNNRMEMRAAIEGLRHARPGERVHVVTDSRYLHDGISKWIHGWKRRGWTKADGGDVLNREVWEELDRLVATPGLRVSWEHVRGHAGHVMNERCDEIATAFARGEHPPLHVSGSSWAAGEAVRRSVDRRSGEPPATGSPAPGERPPTPAFYPAYVSLVGGRVAVHRTWPECEARVLHVSGARHRRVRTPREYGEALRAWGMSIG